MTSLLTQGWYRNYVLGVLTLCYVIIIGVVNVWAALHYLAGARTLRQDLEATEKLAAA